MTTPTPVPDPSIQEVLDRIALSERDRLDTAKARLKTEIILRLKHWGVSKVRAEYSGYGDSGCIDGIAYFDAHDQPVNTALVQPASAPAIEDVLYEFLPAGFEINDGSQGTLTIDVTAGTVALEHGENYTETRNSMQEFTL
jgi:hypothetical protein